MNVRFEGNNGHDADMTRCLLLTQSGHWRRVGRASFSRLTAVGARLVVADGREFGLDEVVGQRPHLKRRAKLTARSSNSLARSFHALRLGATALAEAKLQIGVTRSASWTRAALTYHAGPEDRRLALATSWRGWRIALVRAAMLRFAQGADTLARVFGTLWCYR